jgi:ABC-2 type transport system permease protein
MTTASPLPAPAERGTLSPLGALPTALLIARRAARDSLRDRATLLTSLFFALLLPAGLVFAAIRPIAAGVHTAQDQHTLGAVLATYLLFVGLLPSSAAVGIAAGQFAGEREQGSLTPLLASPAANAAIFGGKVLGAVLPAILFSIVACAGYLGEVAAVTGAETLRLLPPALTVAMLLLVPAYAIFAAGIASLISSRVRTFNSAQQISGLAILPVMFALFGLTFKMQDWGAGGLFIAVGAVLALDVVLIVLSGGTWRREEALARQ